jgi:hypothetical protein
MAKGLIAACVLALAATVRHARPPPRGAAAAATRFGGCVAAAPPGAPRAAPPARHAQLAWRAVALARGGASAAQPARRPSRGMQPLSRAAVLMRAA